MEEFEGSRRGRRRKGGKGRAKMMILDKCVCARREEREGGMDEKAANNEKDDDDDEKEGWWWWFLHCVEKTKTPSSSLRLCERPARRANKSPDRDNRGGDMRHGVIIIIILIILIRRPRHDGSGNKQHVIIR